MAMNASELQKYFADMDAAEEADAAAAGLSPNELRASRLESESEKAARRGQRFAQDLNERNSVGFDAKDIEGMELFNVGETMTPTSMQKPLEHARPNPRSAVGLEKLGRSLREPVDMPETVPSLAMPSGVPAKTSDFASLQKLMSPGALKAPEAAPIPVKTAPSNKDVAAPTVSVREPVTSTSPAGKPDSAGTQGLPAPSSEGAGGDADEERNLYLARLIARNAASFGAMGAGKSIDTGAVEALGERLKQVQALRAKREEQGLEQQRERATWGASNRATLASFMAQYKDRPEVVEALKAQEPGADTTKPSDFLKNLVGSLTTPPKVRGLEAGVARTEAGTGQTLERTATDVATRPGKVAKLEADTELSRARKAKVYKDMEIAGAKLALDERRALEQAQQAKDPFKKLESLNTIADKKEFGGFTTLAGDLADLERVAPGFVTRGEVPEWLTREQQLLGQNWPSSTDPRVVDFLSKYGKVANEERHRQYGSAQTDGELRSFMQQLNSSPLSAGPQVLARQVRSFADAAGRVAKGRLTRYNNVFGAENVDTVFAPEWKPLFNEGGVFAARGSPFVAARPAAAGAPAAPAVERVIMLNPAGEKRAVRAEQVEKAKAQGWRMP